MCRAGPVGSQQQQEVSEDKKKKTPFIEFKLLFFFNLK